MNWRRSSPLASATTRSGFTLTEMLVATALVVMILLMFAGMYQAAFRSIKEQRGMANNDQKARIITNLIRNDLQNMTYRQVSWPYGTARGIVSMAPGDEAIIDPANQRGYFYYSENDPENDIDDVLQFTAMVNVGERGNAPQRNQQLPYLGKAAHLGVVNEPELDDGIDDDGQGQSRAAEIVYFLRGGILYRRVLLLRDPLPISTVSDPQPTSGTNIRLFNPANAASRNYTPASGHNFWNDFDYSATRQYDDVAGNTSYLWFHSVDSLANNLGMANNPIALPWNRYGFCNDLAAVANATALATENGQPREYAQDDGDFIGRLTTEESTDSTLTWPGSPGTTAFYRTVTLALDGNGVVNTLNDDLNRRVGEDILLTNVEAFDVEVYDPAPPFGWTDLQQGPAANGTNENLSYGPHIATTLHNNIIDTWHPNAAIFDGAALNSRPPRIILISRNPPALTEWTWSAAGTPGTGNYLVPDGISTTNPSLIYIPDAIGTTGTKRPEFPPVPNTIVQDGNTTWRCIDNRAGLVAIRITIRFKDIQSGLPRQVTIVHSFAE